MYWVLPQCTVRYEDGVLAKEKQVLQSIIDKLIETLRCYGMERIREKVS
jgi:hypothetical protein